MLRLTDNIPTYSYPLDGDSESRPEIYTYVILVTRLPHEGAWFGYFGQMRCDSRLSAISWAYSSLHYLTGPPRASRWIKKWQISP